MDKPQKRRYEELKRRSVKMKIIMPIPSFASFQIFMSNRKSGCFSVFFVFLSFPLLANFSH